jgi:putative spermidine/putrescine transport system ATP-binding protein
MAYQDPGVRQLDVMAQGMNMQEMSNAAAPFLRLSGVTKFYGAGDPVLDAIDLDVMQGEMVALLGPSGCGKSTLLRSIAGLEPISSGTIAIDGRDMARVSAADRGIGLVFQNYALFPHMTVAQNIAFGLKMRKTARPAIAERVAQMLDLVNLRGMEDRRPAALSGGQQQRVSIARALAIQPRLLLLDEPMSGLDAQLRHGLRLELRRLQQRLGITCLLVTHDQTDAFAVCDKVAVLSHGTVAQFGTPQDIHDHPRTLGVARFIGQSNGLACAIGGDGRIAIGARTFRAETGGLPPGPAVAVVRPHQIGLGSPREAMLISTTVDTAEGVVESAVHNGDVVHYFVDLGGFQLRVNAPGEPGGALRWRAGDRVLCEWDPAMVKVFPA